jgi:mycothiol synthase
MLMNISGIRYEHFSEKDYNTARELLSYDVDAVKTSFGCLLKNRNCLLPRLLRRTFRSLGSVESL